MSMTALRTHTTRLFRRVVTRSELSLSDDDCPIDGKRRGDDRQLTFVTTAGRPVASAVVVAKSLVERLKGLLAHRSLTRDDGLLISPGGSVHTIGMRFRIDVLFLDRHMRVLKTVSSLKPWSGAVAPPRTRYTLELVDGGVQAADIKVGIRLLWSLTAGDDH